MLGGFPLKYKNYMEFCLSVKNVDTLDCKMEALETLLIPLGIWFHSPTIIPLVFQLSWAVVAASFLNGFSFERAFRKEVDRAIYQTWYKSNNFLNINIIIIFIFLVFWGVGSWTLLHRPHLQTSFPDQPKLSVRSAVLMLSQSNNSNCANKLWSRRGMTRTWRKNNISPVRAGQLHIYVRFSLSLDSIIFINFRTGPNKWAPKL